IHGGSITMKQLGKRPINENAAPKGTPTWGKEFKQKSIEYFNRSIPVTSQGTSLPHRNNYLSLDPTYKDAYGNPLLILTYDFTGHDHKLNDYISESCEEILHEIGDVKVEARELPEH